MKSKFPLPHHIIEEQKEVWIVCSSSITAIGIPALMKKHYPDYTACICSEKYLKDLKSRGTLI